MPNTVQIKIYKDSANPPTHNLVDVPWFAGLTVLQAMIVGEAMYQAANFEFAVRYRSIYGAYIFSIDGLSDGDQADHYWMLYVDGAASNYGVSESLIFEDVQKTSALLEWKYEPIGAAPHTQVTKRTDVLPPVTA